MKFIGRGYLQIVGRSIYAKFSAALGVDLLSNPDRALEPKIAAAILAIWSKEREGEFTQALAHDDRVAARRLVTGGLNNLFQVIPRYAVYLSILERGTSVAKLSSVDGIANPKWLTGDLPVLLAAMNEHKIGSTQVKAYALATAEVETGQGRWMKEKSK